MINGLSYRYIKIPSAVMGELTGCIQKIDLIIIFPVIFNDSSGICIYVIFIFISA